jgi:hypothetical protein
MFKISIAIIIVLFVLCCEKDSYLNINEGYNNISSTKNLSISKIDTLRFDLDNFTIPRNRSVSLIEEEQKRLYSFLNNYNNTIYFYDYDSKKLHHKIEFKPNLDTKFETVTGYTVHNRDSIFIYAYKSKNMALINWRGDHIKTYDFNISQGSTVKYPPSPHAWTFEPMVFFNGIIYLSGYVTGEVKDESQSNRPVTAIYDLSKNELSYTGYYPTLYQSANWGGYYYRRVYNTWNKKNRTWVYSFPASHNIHRIKHFKEKKYVEFYAGSKSFESISSLSYPKNKAFSKNLREEHYALNNSYGEIFYDEWRDIYYRFANKKKLDFNGNLYKDKIIIFLDSDLNYIDEIELDELSNLMIYTYGVFISKKV